MDKRLVRSYTVINRPKAKAVLDGFRTVANLRLAIERAGKGLLGDGVKRFSHTYRIPSKVLDKFTCRLVREAGAIANCRDFESLLEIVKACRVFGIGGLGVYDAALHIGAKLDVLPKKVYLHAGTHKGAKRLGLDVSRGYLTFDELPEPIKVLQPYEAEDFLCIYKDKFEGDDASVRGCR